MQRRSYQPSDFAAFQFAPTTAPTRRGVAIAAHTFAQASLRSASATHLAGRRIAGTARRQRNLGARYRIAGRPNLSG